MHFLKKENQSLLDVSALLHKACKEKQENMSYVLLNWFITVTRHLYPLVGC